MTETTLQVISAIGRYATPEVLTVLGALGCLALGWKITLGSLNMIARLASKAGVLGVTAAMLVIGGVGGTGLGIGELVCRFTNSEPTPKAKGVDNSTLLTMAEKCKDSKEMADLLLKYAERRDTNGEINDAALAQIVLTKTTADNKEAVAAFINYLKSKRDRHLTGSTGTLVASRDNTIPVSFTSDEFEVSDKSKTTTPTVKENKDSLMSIPASLAFIGLGIGSVICGAACYRGRKSVA